MKTTIGLMFWIHLVHGYFKGCPIHPLPLMHANLFVSYTNYTAINCTQKLFALHTLNNKTLIVNDSKWTRQVIAYIDGKDLLMFRLLRNISACNNMTLSLSQDEKTLAKRIFPHPVSKQIPLGYRVRDGSRWTNCIFHIQTVVLMKSENNIQFQFKIELRHAYSTQGVVSTMCTHPYFSTIKRTK
ncbi:envelope glycoprotein UL130 [Saimiriine betaherpesvirus 4]|uniref:Envelope glycoprotein UL130 n=1 Tax=Saimiriine betaherpesvirus 4 TaxID=1535247 RepID=G8XT22_9BETA|nr:envelope glycoprotein UL130 [Saimiriine betaherpesvirus 4]AEV80970.1 envelope glycoprotein UL130 [Saimiriine betaherpesvirus 4]